jgi:hypothetical protein
MASVPSPPEHEDAPSTDNGPDDGGASRVEIACTDDGADVPEPDQIDAST